MKSLIGIKNSSHLKNLITRLQNFVPPCLKCLECSNADSHAETSNAIIENIATTTKDISNPSSEEIVALSDENCRLKNLLETGMLKSLKGHQTLCDVLKKSTLHKNT